MQPIFSTSIILSLLPVIIVWLLHEQVNEVINLEVVH